MPIWQIFVIFIFITSSNAAVFKEYYRSGEKVAPSQPKAPFVAPKIVQPEAEKRPEPARQIRIQNQPQPTPKPAPQTTSQTQARNAPIGHFGLNGKWLIRGSFGAVNQTREVTVKSTNTDEAVYYRPKNKLMGRSNGKTLKHKEGELFYRPQIGFGYQLADEGDFWTVDYSFATDLNELLFAYHFTMPNRKIANTLPFVKLLTAIGHNDSDNLTPTSLAFGVGVGGYNYISSSTHWRFEYGVDFARREWLPINHSYGKEEWVDMEWHLYFGASYRF